MHASMYLDTAGYNVCYGRFLYSCGLTILQDCIEVIKVQVCP